MKIIERTHILNQKCAKEFLELLRVKGCYKNAYDHEVLKSIEVDFQDGITVEISVLNGNLDENSSPFLNVNWYKDNMDLYAFDTDPEGELIGTYDFVYEDEDGNETNYLLHLAIEEKSKCSD